MKLHLPIGLRKALLAVFAVVAPATVAVSLANATAMGANDTPASEKTWTTVIPNELNDVVKIWVTNYNTNAADGEALIYSTAYGSKQQITYQVDESRSKWGYTLSGKCTFEGSVDWTNCENYTTIHYNGDGVDYNLSNSKEVAIESGKELKLLGSSYKIYESENWQETTEECSHTVTGKVTGKVSGTLPIFGYQEVPIDYEKSYEISSTHKYITDVYIEHGSVSYTLEGGQELIHDSSISMADGQKANSITIGSTGVENNAAKLSASSISLAADGAIIVQGGSTVDAGTGAISLSGGTVTVDGGIIHGVASPKNKGVVSLVGTTSVCLTGGAEIGGKENRPELISISGGTVTLGDSHMQALKVDVQSTGVITMKDGAYISFTDVVSLDGKQVIMEGGSRITANSITFNADEHIEMRGATTYISNGGTKVSLTAGDYVKISDGAKLKALGNDLEITAKTVILDGSDGAYAVSAKGSVGVTASDVINVVDGFELAGNKGVKLSGSNITIGGIFDEEGKIVTGGSPVKINAANGSIELIGSGGSTIQDGAVVEATAGNVKMSSTGITAANTITGSTVTAGGEFSMVGDEANLIIYTHPTSGTNTITDSTIQAGSTVNLHGLLNTIKGTVTDGGSSTLVSGSGVNVGVNKGTLYNDITGASVTATTGNIVMNAIANNVGTGSVLTSEQGSIALKGATIEGLSTLLNALGSLDIDLPIDSLDISANMVAGTLNAGQKVSMDATGNLLTGGTVQGGTGVALNGTINAVAGTHLTAENGDIAITSNGKAGDLVGTLVNLLGDKLPVDVNTEDLSTILSSLTGGANVMTGGSLTAQNGNVTLNGMANVMMGGSVNGKTVLYDGAINYVDGINITGNTITFKAGNDKTLPIGETLSSFVGLLFKDVNEDDPDNQQANSLADMLNGLELDGSVNLLMGEDTLVGANAVLDAEGNIVYDANNNIIFDTDAAISTKVEMIGTGNILSNHATLVGNTVNMEGALNVIAGGNIHGDKITLSGGEGLDLGGIVNTLLGNLNKENTETLAEGGEESGTPEEGTKMKGSLNLMTSGTVAGTDTVTFDATVNAVTDGSISGGEVVFKSAEGGLALGSLVDVLLKYNEGLPDDEKIEIQDWMTKLATLKVPANANIIIGADVTATASDTTTGNLSMTGLLNYVDGAMVNAQGAASIEGPINVVRGTTELTGSTVTMNALKGDLNLGDILGAFDIFGDSEADKDAAALLGGLTGGVNVIEGKNTLVQATAKTDENGNAIDGSVSLIGTGNVILNEATVAGQDVLMKGTLNVTYEGNVDAEDSVLMQGLGNAVLGGSSVTGNTITMEANADSQIASLGGVITNLIPDSENLDPAIKDLIGNLGGNINAVIGTDALVDAAESVTMTGTGNIVADFANVTGETVDLSGDINVLYNGNVKAEGTQFSTATNPTGVVTMSGIANVVMDGSSIDGDSIIMEGNNKTNGSLLSTILKLANISDLDPAIESMLNELTGKGNANLVMGKETYVGSENTQSVSMTGIGNIVMGGAGVTGNKVTLDGIVNFVDGADTVLNGSTTLTLNGPANIVTGGTLSGGSVELKGDDMPLGSLVGGLLDGVLEGVELPEELNGLVSGSVTDVLNNLTGNFNVVTGDKAVIAADSTASLTGTVNYVGDNASVTGNNVTVKGAANVVLNGATLEAEDALTLTGTGAGLSLGSFITIPEEYKEYADQLGLTALLNKEASANVVMGNETSLVGKTVELSAMVNMLSDRAMVTGGEVALNGNLNIVTDGVNIETTSEDISLVGDLNLVTHIVLDDLMNAIQNGTALPTDNGEYTTLLESAGDINLIGAANAVHGDVVLNAKGDVLMEGSGQPLFNTDSLNLQQVVDLAAKLGAGELLGTAKDEALNLIKDYINSNDLSGLKEMAQQLGAEDIINGTLADAKGSLLDFIAQYADAKLPQLDLTGNVNVVSTGAYVHGANVTMNGTANLVTDGAKIEADDTVSMNGMANIVAGGSTVSGTDVNLSGGMNVIVDTTLDNVKDAITNGSLDSIATGGTTQTTIAAKDELVLDATANLVNGYVSLSSDNSVTMEGITNVVAGEAEVQGANSVEMDGVLNVVAGGATVGSSAGDITMGGGMNMIVDTSLENVVDALQQQSLAPLMQGGSIDTTLKAASDITLNATVNAVNGGQVTLEAGDTMKMSGAVNVVSGNATLKGEDIVMAGDKSLAVDLNKLLPAEWADKAAELGLSDMLEGGLSLNAVAGGANLIAEDDITMSGIASVVVDTSMGNIMEALATQSIDPLIKGGTSETNLEANNINMLSKLNVVSGGKVRLDAENNVKMDGVANMVHGNTVVEAGNTISVSGAANVVAGGATLDAKNITMTGTGSISADLEGLLPADWAEKAAELGLTDVLEKGVNVNAVAGGANLLADEDITMGGMASFVVDTTVENVVDALKQMSIDPLLQGGTTETVLSAEREIHMNSLVNVVAGGKVTVEAGRNVNMSGVANVVNGNAVVDAGETIYMCGAANVVSGGADLTADYIEMTGNGTINGKIAGVLESVLPGVDLPTNGSVNAILGEGTTLDADKVALSGALNVVDGATVSGDDSVLMNGNVNMLSNNAQVVSENGNITINGGAGVQSVTTMENASLTAEKGKVVFNNALVGSTDSTVTAGLGMTVKGNSSVQLNDVLLGGETLVSADSDLEIDGMLRTNDGAFIENMGSLSLHDVALSAGTELFNGGVIQIDGDLSLDSAKLTFVIESLTNNDTAITLGANANITAADITNVTFVIESDKVASALYNYEEFSFVLFENASAEDFSLVEAALAQDEITFTINGATWSDFKEELEVRHEGGNIVIMGNVVIPEPTTATLSLLALAALAARRRRK